MRSLIAIAAILSALPCISSASEFDWMTREFARQSGTQPTHIPFFGLARFVVAVARPAGTSDLHLAIFEHAKLEQERFSQVADTTIGAAWKPIIRVHDRAGEVSNIYVQPQGKHLQVLIATLSNDEVVFVQVRIKPEDLIKFVDEERHNKNR